MATISVTSVDESDPRRPVATLSSPPSRAWTAVFNALVAWARDPEHHESPGCNQAAGSFGYAATHEVGYTVRRNKIDMVTRIPGLSYENDIKDFLEETAVACANDLA
jgi:hypothetical protein